jgi:pyridoxine 5-phosphate synthase
LFVEPDLNQIDVSAEINADFIEIHTGVFANTQNEEDMFDELETIRQAVKHAKKLGLGVNAGHGLNYQNIKEFIAIKDIDEVSIGQAVIAKSVFVGLEKAIKEMIDLINKK